MAKTLLHNVVVHRTGYGPIWGNETTVPNDVAALITNPAAWTLNAASQAEMLALSSATVDDVCIRTDTEPDSVYVLTAAPPATLGNWTLLNPQTGPDFGGIDLATQAELVAGLATKEPSIPTGTYVPADPVASLTYNADGTVATATENGIVTTFAYNADGTVATTTRLGVTRTYTYTGGNLTAVA